MAKQGADGTVQGDSQDVKRANTHKRVVAVAIHELHW
jgi:hypothetical protein